MKKATTRAPLIATNSPREAADRHANLTRRDCGLGRGFVDTERNSGERCWFKRAFWRAAASCGRLLRAAGRPLLEDALIWEWLEALGKLRRGRETLEEMCDARDSAPACRESMVLDAAKLRLGRCGHWWVSINSDAVNSA